MRTIEDSVKALLELADIQINGSRPQDIVVNDNRFYARLIKHRELGLGEAYMDGWWSCRRLDQLIAHLLLVDIQSQLKINLPIVMTALSGMLINKESISRTRKNLDHHYNIGNDLYERMLDKRMVYSCAYWQNAKTLDEAQKDKLDLICRKLHLKKGMSVLDIGCGWGGFSEFAARNYGVHVTGISPVIEQVKVAKSRTKDLPVKILQKDYREISGTFNRIVSVGMLEHVGPKNHKKFFEACFDMLTTDGIMLHHTIGVDKPYKYGDPWIEKYIFPGSGILPCLSQLEKAIEKRFIIEDLHNFGPDYDLTLLAWHQNFKKHYKEIKQSYDQRFYRMWEYYLLACAGAFRARDLQLWQIVMRKRGTPKTYISVR